MYLSNEEQSAQSAAGKYVCQPVIVHNPFYKADAEMRAVRLQEWREENSDVIPDMSDMHDSQQNQKVWASSRYMSVIL